MRGQWVALLAVVGIPALLYLGLPLGERTSFKAGRYAQETSALKAIQTLNTAQVQYNSQFGRFARSFTELGAAASNLIPADLAVGGKQGYKFTLTPTPQGYCIQAVPTLFGTTGSRTFYSDQSLLIRQSYGPEPATANSREVGSTTGISVQAAR